MGLALAQKLSRAGDHVTVVGRDPEKLQRVRADCAGPDRPATIVTDITIEQEVEALFARCSQLDHIVCTAAEFTGAYARLPALDLAAARRAIESKIVGPIHIAKHGAPTLATGGSLTFVSGIAAYRPMPRGTVVATINAALEGLVRALAVELAPIRVNAVSPGWVDTPIWQVVAGEGKAEVLDGMAARLPVGRVGRPEDIADALAFVIGNGFTTGTVLHVEGGHRLV
ncbi:SDR family oxidoreductase [Mangrovibrevibacter kandeliae]|uniref:SDR family oxidoreductase n=1 Tax=Mangrovibrevibacter kandeliae TaxID=2968473 RepID=UPI002118C0A5|nr:SDR family oxidoreductase [Aurantimonas sp. CSK15Z-1]MCQ8781369.1 SDR family oxidoreductase [Aurantimonas sp. CSK15Z-1]